MLPPSPPAVVDGKKIVGVAGGKKSKSRLSNGDIDVPEIEILLERNKDMIESIRLMSLLDTYKVIIFSALASAVFFIAYTIQASSVTHFTDIYTYLGLLERRNPMMK